MAIMLYRQLLTAHITPSAIGRARTGEESAKMCSVIVGLAELVPVTSTYRNTQSAVESMVLVLVLTQALESTDSLTIN